MTATIQQVDESFVAENLSAIRDLLNVAYEGEFSEEDWLHTFGGARFVGLIDQEIVAHGAVIARDFMINSQARRVGYLEGVAVSVRHQGIGIGSQLLLSMSEFAASEYPVSMLSTDEFEFYSRFGWNRFQGKSGVLLDGSLTLTPDEDNGLMYLTGKAGFPEEIHTAHCDAREGDDW